MVRFLAGIIAFSIVVSVNAAETINFERIVEKARQLAAQPYKEPEPIPRFIRELTYDQYQNIRFDPDKSLWKQGKSMFQVMLIPPGLYYGHPVKINIIDSEGARELPFKKELFTFADPELEKKIPADLGYAGVKLTFPFFESNVQNQFLVFAGASYFRGVGRHNGWGISSRGIAVDTGLSTGEEFPSFTDLWLVHPAVNSDQMIVYGILDGPSIAGAYQFVIKPGDRTIVDVKTVLFTRNTIQLLGIAPLTSMFYYGENTARPAGEWRSQVHDSDGLLIQNGNTGEWLWRPLINPLQLQMDYFSTEDVTGFGLLQRDDQFENYHDLGARYEIRPSAWVKPKGKWGPGQIVLVQLPTRDETNDNIVAFWTPAAAITPQEPYAVDYTLTFGNPDVADQTTGHAVNTFIGDGSIIGGGQQAGAYRVIVDFAGADLDKLPSYAKVEGSVTGLEGTEVLEFYVEYNPGEKNWRLSILAKPEVGKSLALRAFLQQSERPLTETWTYRLPPQNDIRIERN
jgi:glucans biosynthesis protein